MNLDELQKSLTKFGGDFKDAHIVLITKDHEGKKQYSLLAGVGQLLIDRECVALISEDICNDMISDGTIKFKKDLED
jgi:hypothetical protein